MSSIPGMVTVMERGQVRFKVIALCNGHPLKHMAARLLDLPRITLQAAFLLAQGMEFGGTWGLVVMGRSKVRKTNSRRLPPEYRQTFRQPKCFPEGIAPTIVIDISVSD